MKGQYKKNTPEWHVQKTYESLITYGQNALKFIFTSNGGAILAILTFVGHYPERISSIKYSLFFFIAGVIAGGLANATAYLTQFVLFNEDSDCMTPFWNHTNWLLATIILIFLGIVFFAVGAIMAAAALQ